MASHMPCASNRLARRTIVCTARTSKIGDASRSPTRPATRVYAQHTADHPTLQQMVVLTSGVLGTGMLAQPAWAEGLALPQVEGVDQVLVAIGFALAVALLTILTLGVCCKTRGITMVDLCRSYVVVDDAQHMYPHRCTQVAYLSITSWLDSRAENSDRQLFSVQDADR